VTIAARDVKKLETAYEMLSQGIKDTGQKLIHISVDCGKSLNEGIDYLLGWLIAWMDDANVCWQMGMCVRYVCRW